MPRLAEGGHICSIGESALLAAKLWALFSFQEAARETVAAIFVARLTAKQEAFARNIASGMKQGEAAIAAGYSEKSADAKASGLVKNGKVLARIAELQAPAIEAVGANAQWITEQLVRVYTEAMDGNPVLDRYGNPTGDRVSNYAGANRALELLGKRRGVAMFVESKDVTTRDETLADLAKLTPAERQSLRELLTGEEGGDPGDTGQAGREGSTQPLPPLH